jgi:cell wall-associated NlpC family hydrolase
LATLIKVDTAKLLRLHGAVQGRVKYVFGAKARPLCGGPEALSGGVDCSGYVRWLMFHCSGVGYTFPDGSTLQADWCRKQGFKQTSYRLNGGWKDGRLRLCAYRPKGKRAGHIWLCLDGRTIESAGGKGPTRRSWLTPVLYSRCETCYVLTEPAGS